MFWVIPDYRTTATTQTYKPLTTNEKFRMAWQGSLDPGSFLLAGVIAGVDQLTGDNNRTFGQGVQGYACRFGTSYGDVVIEDFMTEAVFPSLLHQDPRYFRLGTGSGWARLGHAVKQVFWTRNDSGRRGFNYSEFAGAATATAIANAYYPERRTAADNLQMMGFQVGIDMASNVGKEFWPDVYRKVSGRKGAVVHP